jgi:hypothetical protein
MTSFKFRDKSGSVASANGIEKLQIKKSTKKNVAKAKLKMRGTEIPAVGTQPQMAFSLLFGTDPATDDCITASSDTCKPRGDRNSCKG